MYNALYRCGEKDEEHTSINDGTRQGLQPQNMNKAFKLWKTFLIQIEGPARIFHVLPRF